MTHSALERPVTTERQVTTETQVTAERQVTAGRQITAARRLHGRLGLPSDKSVAHRALLANAIAGPGDATIIVRAPGADVRSTASAIAAAGATVGEEPSEASGRAPDTILYRVRGTGTGGELGELRCEHPIDCGNSGTTMRLLCGILAGARGDGRGTRLVGDSSLSRRPMGRVAEPLRAMGAEVQATDGRPPLVVRGGRPLRALQHRPTVASAQVLGAIAFAALAAEGETEVAMPSRTRDHTERLLAAMGARIGRDGLTTHVRGPAVLRPRSITVAGDPSSAAAWLVAAALHPDAEVTVEDVGLNPSRTAFIDVLREMGADVRVDEATGSDPEPVGDITVRTGSVLRPVSLGDDRVAGLIDELPLLAIAMAAANGTSELRDAPELRVKESDRISAMVGGLASAGVGVEELSDGWRIAGNGPRAIGPTPAVAAPGAPVAIETRGDHRIAIAFAIAATVGLVPAVALDDAACVTVSYPGFWDDLATLTSAG